MIQFEEIVKDLDDKNVLIEERMKFLFFMDFPTYPQLIKKISECYFSINCYQTSLSLYIEKGLYY